ncbi:MAG: hypothetical protein QG641_2128 [Candidatus Poribacteria bacterium]|nr:hypothetical protein [Candidatus Poribacteria bacterium]
MFHKFKSRLKLEGNLVAETALRIGGSRSIEPVGTDLPVVKDSLGMPYIPGSSFKGVLRSRVEQLVRTLINGKEGACIPIDLEKESCITSGDMANFRKQTNEDEYLTKLILGKLCLVCQLFGSPWFASRIQISDLYVDKSLWFDQYQIRNGVAIDRDTGTAKDGMLYDYEVVTAGTEFGCKIVVENAEPWQLGMLMLGIHPFECGEIAVGGGSSRGLGKVKIDWQNRWYFAVNGNTDEYFDFLLGKYHGDAVDNSKIEFWISKFKEKIMCLRQEGGECTKN